MPKASEAVERRLVHRLLEHWRILCPENGFPAAAQIDPRNLDDIWPYCFILTTGQEGAPWSIDRAGWAFSGLNGNLPMGADITALAPSTPARNVTFFLEEVLARKVPVSRGGAFADGQGVIRLFRSILLPLSSDGSEIDAILGAANCRPIASEADEIVYHAAGNTRRAVVTA